jgi:CheY-specific phosphatase CheX
MEKQAFMFAEEGGWEERAAEGDWTDGSISFKGPFSGSVALAAPRAMALELAGNFLGRDSSDPEVAAGADDSFKELLNVICGHMLTALAGEDPIFDLSMPAVNALTAARAAEIARHPDALTFTVDGHQVFLRVALEGDWRPIDAAKGQG